jgi:pimeloyl-ACP methyl ester carboxylesterase
MVHGSGNSDRSDWGKYRPIMDRMLNAGFAVLCWDKPGVRESTGRLASDGDVIGQRASILFDAIEQLKLRPDIDPDRIGAWGISQGGVVIPWALRETDSIAFAIVVSGPGTDGIAQSAYVQSRWLICEGYPEETARRAEASLAALPHSATYEEYLGHMLTLLGIPALGYEEDWIDSEEEWAPWGLSEGATFNPIGVIAQTTIPVLAFFGEHDIQVDPVQGFAAYQHALEEAGHPLSEVIWVEGAGHTLNRTRSGCADSSGRRYAPDDLDKLEAWIRSLW